MPLRFGPYPMPRCKIGGKLDCEYAGTLRIVAISDAPQPWPLGIVWGIASQLSAAHWSERSSGNRTVTWRKPGELGTGW